MPNKAAGLIVCLVLAALVSWGVGYWIDTQLDRAGGATDLASYDGSLLRSVQNWDMTIYGSQMDSRGSEDWAVSDSAAMLQKLVFAYDRYLYQGGGENWLNWRETYDKEYTEVLTEGAPPSEQWRAQLLKIQDRAMPTKWIALLGFIFSILILWSGRLKEYHLATPVFYASVVGLTLWAYGAMSAPFWCLVMGAAYLVYALGLWLLPMYRTEWVRSLRPLLTIFLVFLAAIAWRGPDGLDRVLLEGGFWRFLVLGIAGFGLFLHWDHLARALKQAKVSTTGSVMGYTAALGGCWLVLGLLVGFWQSGDYHGLALLNLELQIVPEQWAIQADPDWAFGLFFVGFGMVIFGSIGYFIQRIAR
ncbi:MAG: hypothetical protein AAF544_08445 [Bacteroidota bacterium]